MKKVWMTVLSVCAAVAMTACSAGTDKAEVKETVETQESAEADAQEQALEEEEAKAQEEAEEQARIAEAGECYEAGRKSLYGLEGAQIDLADAYTNFARAQELGNIDANFYLGALTDWYDYPEKNYEQARVYYEQCEDNPYAQISLGFLYYNVQVEWKDGLLWEDVPNFFQSAVDQGIAEGYVGLAAIARDEGDYETALEYYQKVVEEGTEQLYIVHAMRSIAYLYWYGNGVEEDGAKAIEWFTKAADLGDVESMVCIGELYDWDDSVEQDYDMALEWYTKAADLGDAESMNRIGVMYHNGEGVAQDYDVAMEWFQKAADLDYAQAMCNIAYMYQAGNGVAQDGSAAIEWFTKAADLGDSGAMEEIGNMYKNGAGVEQDDDAALEWYVKSLSIAPAYWVYESITDILHGEEATLQWFEESGDPEKMIALADMYRSNQQNNGQQLFPIFEKAVEWYTKAADLGSIDAIKRLGDLYYYGFMYGGEQDTEKAIEWYTKAADLGDAESKSMLENLQEVQEQ
ncbi:MAG: tetratricopeptide/SEL1-like repeat protein [Lachnospiraceae bacterium]|nr:tetratricopeptide/SEL1-like repeat protein [Lachnospiraceae bacterium]